LQYYDSLAAERIQFSCPQGSFLAQFIAIKPFIDPDVSCVFAGIREGIMGFRVEVTGRGLK